MNNNTEEFLQKLAPCIERGELDACVEEAARLAQEMGVGAGELLELSTEERRNDKYHFSYVIALAAAQVLEGEAKAQAYSNAGLALHCAENIQKAEEYYQKAIEADRENSEAHYNYANLLDELDRKKEAEEHYQKAIEADRENSEAHYNYAIFLSELDKKKETEDHYLKAIEANPKFAEAHTNYATLLSELGRKKEAEEHYLKAIEANPKLVEAHTNYATLLSELGRKKEAEEHYLKAIEANPKFAEARISFAYFLKEKSMFFDAEKQVRIALQIEPEDPYALRTYGDILADEDYLEEALKKYHEAIKNSDSMEQPEKAEIHNNLGWVYAHLEQYKRAEKEFEEAYKLDPQNVKVIRNKRALGKVKSEPKISKMQWCIAIVLFAGVIATWYLFLTNKKLTENIFSAQTIILIAMIIFILFYHQLGKFKAGPIEFEKSTEHRSQPLEAIAKIKR